MPVKKIEKTLWVSDDGTEHLTREIAVAANLFQTFSNMHPGLTKECVWLSRKVAEPSGLALLTQQAIMAGVEAPQFGEAPKDEIAAALVGKEIDVRDTAQSGLCSSAFIAQFGFEKILGHLERAGMAIVYREGMAPERDKNIAALEVRWRGHRHKWSVLRGETVLREGMESREEAEKFCIEEQGRLNG